MSRLAWLALLVAPSLSCGLIDPDVTEFNLRLPEKPFNVDTADWNLNVMGSSVPTLDCPPIDCALAETQFCSMGACEVACDANLHCAAAVSISVFNEFNLEMESPELTKIDAQAVISVTVEQIAFRIETNTLNVATPPLEVHLAPVGINDPNDPMAEAIGTIAAVQVGQVGAGMIELTPDGKTVMQTYMSNWRTPFHVIVSGDVTISAGTPVPQGALAGVVTVTAHAGL
jgi:hypothetical protein